MLRCFLGVDVGASKTHALIADESGRPIAFSRAAGANPELVGYDGLSEVLHEVVRNALQSADISKDAIGSAGYGVGGYDWPSQKELMMDVITSLRLPGPNTLVNDSYPPLLAGTSDGWGVSIIAGYGCNCRGWDRSKREGRVTGFSRFGEGAGGHELVQSALQAIAHEWTLRGPSTQLSDAFLQLTEADDVQSLLEGVSLGRIQVGAEAAPTVFHTAAEGDDVARELVRWAGKELGGLAVGVIRQLGLEDEEFEVVLAGSFFRGSPVVQKMIEDTVHGTAPLAKVKRLEAPPVAGSVLLAMEQAGMDIRFLREPLLTNIEEEFGESSMSETNPIAPPDDIP